MTDDGVQYESGIVTLKVWRIHTGKYVEVWIKVTGMVNMKIVLPFAVSFFRFDIARSHVV